MKYCMFTSMIGVLHDKGTLTDKMFVQQFILIFLFHFSNILNNHQRFIFQNFILIENIVSLGAAAASSDSPFGSKVRKGMFRTVGQLYKV